MYSTEIAQNLFHNLKNYICGFIYLLECKIFQVLLEVGFIDFTLIWKYTVIDTLAKYKV